MTCFNSTGDSAVKSIVGGHHLVFRVEFRYATGMLTEALFILVLTALAYAMAVAAMAVLK